MMHSLHQTSRVVIAAAALGALAALGSEPSSAANTLSAFPNGNVGKATVPLVYVSDNANSVVDIFTQTGLVNNQIDLFAAGALATDSAGNVYVASSFSPKVNVYGPGQTSPKLTLTTSQFQNTSVAVNSAGEVAVISAPQFNGISELNLFQPGSTTPFETFACTIGSQQVGGASAAWDAHGDLFLLAGSTVVEVVSGTQTCTPTSIPNNGNSLLVDGKGHILVSNTYANTITVYANSKSSSGKSYAVTAPFAMTLSLGDTHIWVADLQANQIEDSADEYTYPGFVHVRSVVIPGGPQGYSFPYGIAVTPWAAP